MAGPAGMDAFQALNIPVQYFRVSTATDDDDDDGTEISLDLNDYVAHATGDVSFEIIDVSGWLQTVETGAGAGDYDLDGSTLTLSVGDVFTPVSTDTPNHVEDSVIRIEATDDDDNSAVLYVRVRGNLNPTGSGTLGLTIGTQDAPADDSDDPDYFDSEDEPGARVECPMLNHCKVNLIDVMGHDDVFTDGNRREKMLTFQHYHADTEAIMVRSTSTGVEIIGEMAGDPVTVVVWVTDDAGMPMLPEEDNEDTAELDESVRPANDAAYVITVTVDRQPYLSQGAVGTKTITVADPTNAADAVVGTVFDDQDSTLGDGNLSFTPGIGDQGGVPGGIASIAWEGAADRTSDPRRREISVDGLNPGTVALNVKVTETEADNDPTQYAESTITVTVTT